MAASDLLQDHLFKSFLEASTTDVSLEVSFRSSYRAVYRLHRVVLIQSGFFRSLFTAGFSEASPDPLRREAPIQIVFDDPNITRPAFELCIARLYGGGPELYVPPSLFPTATRPLASFPCILEENVPDKQLASPQFLLSLLSTSIFLSIPSLVSLALSTILRTVGPYTVLQYLAFACGKPLRSVPDEVPAVGLEHVADEAAATDDFLSHDMAGATENSSSAFYYGSISDKIGEAAVCWLARWGPDFFVYEEGGEAAVQDLFLSKSSLPSSKLSPTRKSCCEGEIQVPVIWRRNGGLTAPWIRALISSDCLFVKSEIERYHLARSIVEFRRKHDGVIPEEEEEWAVMFDQSIYYTNMDPEDLVHISQDISTITNLPFVSPSTLHGAAWDQLLLRHHILSKPPSSGSSSPPPRDKELGIVLSSRDLASRNDLPVYRVSENSSLRIGENGQSMTSSPSMDDFFALSQSPSKSKPAQSREITSEDAFFGLLPSKSRPHTANPRALWSPFPPLRFSVEFWDLDHLKEKMRLYSQTVWYAGSLFNVYVQCVKKKGQPQLGVYVHRQSSLDPVPPSSCPLEATDKTAIFSHSDVAPRPSSPPASPTQGLSHYSPSIHPPTRSPTPSSLPPYSAVVSARPPMAPSVSPRQPYRDPRPVLSAYFVVCCSSPTGNSQTRFSSAPDVFKVSQSWGWKTSVLWGDTESGTVESTVDLGKEVSLRASIVLGLV